MKCFLFSYFLQEIWTTPLGYMAMHSFFPLWRITPLWILMRGKAVSHPNASRTLLLSNSYCGSWRNTLEYLCLCLHKKSIEVHWTPVKLLSRPSMKCSAYWRIKSGSSSGCSADPYMLSIVCAFARSRMSPSFGHRLKKSRSNLHYQVAAAFGSIGALANYRLFHPIFQSWLFFRLNVVTMLFLSAHCNS